MRKYSVVDIIFFRGDELKPEFEFIPLEKKMLNHWSIFSDENRLVFWSRGCEWKGGIQLKIVLCLKQKSQRRFKDNTYPLCHLLLQKRLNNSKDAFENPGLIYYVHSLDSDWKPILWIRRETALRTLPNGPCQTFKMCIVSLCKYYILCSHNREC